MQKQITSTNTTLTPQHGDEHRNKQVLPPTTVDLSYNPEVNKTSNYQSDMRPLWHKNSCRMLPNPFTTSDSKMLYRFSYHQKLISNRRLNNLKPIKTENQKTKTKVLHFSEIQRGHRLQDNGTVFNSNN